MKRKILLSALFINCTAIAFAQNLTKEFQIAPPVVKAEKSFYSYAEVLDSRPDTSNFGIVQRGAFNRKARLIAKPSIEKQLTDMLPLMVDSTAGKDTILVQLRHMSFAELTGSFSEKGYCHLRTTLYSRKDDRYYKIADIDTTLLTKAMDVTAENIRRGGGTLVNFISDHLASKGDESASFTKYDLWHIDSIEKSTLPLYRNASIAPGVYYSYNAFKNQVPDSLVQIDVTLNDSKFTLKAINAAGKKEKLNPSKVYAVVTTDQAFVGTPTGFYLLSKMNDEFHFVGKAKVTANNGDVLAAGLMFGLVGSLLASSEATAVFEMTIDHYNGHFIKVREIKQPSTW